MATLPLWVRKFFVDAVETGVAAIFVLQFALPTSVDEGVRVGGMVLAAVAGALISAARRAAPDFIAWLASKLGTAS